MAEQPRGRWSVCQQNFVSRDIHYFGAGDPYLNQGVAEHFHEAFPTSELFLLHKGHWPQLDDPEEVARLLPGVSVTPKH
jgi:pimeloyl-ACP methyl ester carboxylesterase